MNKDEEQTQNQREPNELRRDFLKKFGKYAVSTPAVTFTLMSTFSSKAVASHGGAHGGDDGAGGL